MEALSLLVWPFLACVVLVLIHAYFGIHILERGIIFVDIALAQFVGIGIALSFLLGHEEGYVFSSIFAILGASILSLSKRINRIVNIEAFIGVLYIFSFAASILILDRSPHGMEEFKAILNGDILWVKPAEVLSAFVLYAFIGCFHFVFRKRFFALSSHGADANNLIWEFLFFFSFALVLVKSVQMAGILQVFSFLIVPVLIGRLYTRKPSKVLLIGWVTGLIASIVGIGISYKLDLPTAPLTVAALSVMFFMLLAERAIRKKTAF
jgi:zinc/manganese transport system permease protein